MAVIGCIARYVESYYDLIQNADTAFIAVELD